MNMQKDFVIPCKLSITFFETRQSHFKNRVLNSEFLITKGNQYTKGKMLIELSWYFLLADHKNISFYIISILNVYYIL